MAGMKTVWGKKISETFNVINFVSKMDLVTKGGSRTAATSKLERFVIIVNGWKLAAVLGPPLLIFKHLLFYSSFTFSSYTRNHF